MKCRSPGLFLSLLLSALMLGGCFTNISAEGFYVESEASGRYQESLTSSEPVQLYRLKLSQFDEEVGGIVETFRVNRYTSFELEEGVITTPSDHFFCTRFESGSIKDDRIALEFTGALNRRWRVTGELDEGGDLIKARLRRVSAAGVVVDPTLYPESLPLEDQRFLSSGRDESEHLMLERQSASVSSEQLDCVEHRLDDSLNLDGLPDLPEGRVFRVGMILSRAFTSTNPEEPLQGLSRKQVLTATLDEWDLVNEARSLLLRTRPELYVDSERGLAIGTLIIYEELRDPNDQWENLRNLSSFAEPVWAYSPAQVVVYLEGEASASFARGMDGALNSVPLFEDGAAAPMGWAVYGYTGKEVVLQDGEAVNLIEQLRRDPGAFLTFEAIPERCRFCYPEPDPDLLPDGVPMPDCEECPPLLPLLFL